MKFKTDTIQYEGNALTKNKEVNPVNELVLREQYPKMELCLLDILDEVPFDFLLYIIRYGKLDHIKRIFPSFPVPQQRYL